MKKSNKYKFLDIYIFRNTGLHAFNFIHTFNHINIMRSREDVNIKKNSVLEGEGGAAFSALFEFFEGLPY